MELMRRTTRVPPSLSVRDPRAATITGVVGSASRFNSRTDLWNADTAMVEAYYANIYVYACARARAQDMSSLPLRVGADPEKPKDFDPKHPIAKLLGPAPGGPTMNISARRLIAWSLTQYDITGRFIWEIAAPVNRRKDGVPFELWPIPASFITPIESDGGGDWFKYFEYVNRARRQQRMMPDQIIYHWRPHQTDWRKAESLLEAASLNVSIATMQDRYDYAFLVNDARPAAVVVHEEFQQKRERDGFRRQFLESHRGPDNAGKVAFVEASRDGALPKDSLLIQTLGLSQKDAMFIDRMENQIRSICVAFNTPLSRLADSSRRTYSNAEVEGKHYWRTGVYPAGIEFCEALNIDIMPRIGDPSNVCWFDKTGVPELEPARRFAVGDIPDLIEHGVLNRNEARTSIEQAEIDDPAFEEYELGVEEQPALPPAPPEPKALPPARAVSAAAFDSVLLGLARLWDDAVRSVQNAQTTAVIRRFEGKRGRQAAKAEDLTGLHDQAYWMGQTNERLAGVFRSIYLSAVGLVVASEVDCLNPEDSPVAVRWIETRASSESSRLVSSIQNVMQRAIPGTLVESLEAMLSSQLYEVDPYHVRVALSDALSTCTGKSESFVVTTQQREALAVPTTRQQVISAEQVTDRFEEIAVRLDELVEATNAPPPPPTTRTVTTRTIVRDEFGAASSIIETSEEVEI